MSLMQESSILYMEVSLHMLFLVSRCKEDLHILPLPYKTNYRNA